MQIGLKPDMNPRNGFFARLSRGFRSGLEGLQNLFKEGLIVYAILPAIIGLLVGLGLAYASFSLLNYWLLEGLESTGALNSRWLSWLDSVAVVLSVIASFFVYIGLYRFVISLVIFPLLGPMVDRLELQYRGRQTRTTFSQDLGAGLYGAYVGLVQAILGLLVLVLSIFAGPLQPFLVGLADGYFYGYGAFSLMLERDFPEHGKRKFEFKRYRPEILGNGLLFVLLLGIPVLGALLAPIACVAGACRLYYTQLAPGNPGNITDQASMDLSQ